jgi:hypothetical protein
LSCSGPRAAALFLCDQANFITVLLPDMYQSVSFCIETTASVTVCRSSFFSSCTAFSSNPAQRNLQMSLTISLDAGALCFVRFSMTVLARVLASIALRFAGVAAPTFDVAAVLR